MSNRILELCTLPTIDDTPFHHSNCHGKHYASVLRHKRIFSAAIFSAILSRVTSFDPTDASLVSIERIFDAVQKWCSIIVWKIVIYGSKMAKTHAGDEQNGRWTPSWIWQTCLTCPRMRIRILIQDPLGNICTKFQLFTRKKINFHLIGSWLDN